MLKLVEHGLTARL